MSKYTFEPCDVSDLFSRRGVQTFKIMSTDDTPVLLGFLTNQYGVGYQIASEYDDRFQWRLFAINGKQIQPWNINVLMTKDEAFSAIQMSVNFKDIAIGVIIEAVTEMGMTGFLTYDGMGEFVFHTYPRIISMSDFTRVRESFDKAGLPITNRLDGSKRPAVMIGDTVATVRVKYF